MTQTKCYNVFRLQQLALISKINSSDSEKEKTQGIINQILSNFKKVAYIYA